MIMETSPREDPSALLKYCSPYVADGCILLSSVGHHVSRDILFHLNFGDFSDVKNNRTIVI